ncbi:aminotransferase class I/II-fold pyridoxal phosphate-dependent enzyme [Enteroscipio rubneri]|uniref:Aminotransferase n=1 Tax=Enteroscipio rubneri TaxID=2070686 RepID=A0A2K2U9T5_9ACTN|nr:aminotransferase class I/II-fold pyridoxal phosphate-dependent enzyme [Enteroscipio rubneri]PNV67044.1 aminotransferase [Enteroscipio rubneri]
MPTYVELGNDELAALKDRLEREHAEIKARGLSLNMARGKPAKAQLDLSMPLLETITTLEDCVSTDGTDCRNYGVVDGLPEAKALMASMLDDDPENVIVCGNASLNIMYDALARCWSFGTLGSTPWSKLETVRWICPVPGYDRHFGVTEAFGIEMIPVPMTDEGPDMGEVESIAAFDENVKGIWCVPKYSNPGGITYSDEVVRRLASMVCAADDFRIFWDNAYCVHHLFDDAAEQDQLLDIGHACVEAGNPDRYFKFASTSKVTFPGAGISALAASPANVVEIKKRMGVQTIGHDKLNQLRHVRFLKDAEGLAAHMAKHAAILRPKFELVNRKLEESLADVGGCSWSKPRGGYFVSFDAPESTAKRIVALAKEAGVTMTGAGATFPLKQDPRDSNIRIAPTLPPLEELDEAMDVFACCVKLAYAEHLLARRQA